MARKQRFRYARSLTVEPALAARVKALADRQERSETDIIRELLTLGLDKWDPRGNGWATLSLAAEPRLSATLALLCTHQMRDQVRALATKTGIGISRTFRELLRLALDV